MMTGNTVIIGAGPAGLTAAYELRKRVTAPRCLRPVPRWAEYRERKTIEAIASISVGTGFSKVPLINDLWQEILGEAFRPRLSRIYTTWVFFDYPEAAQCIGWTWPG